MFKREKVLGGANMKKIAMFLMILLALSAVVSAGELSRVYRGDNYITMSEKFATAGASAERRIPATTEFARLRGDSMYIGLARFRGMASASKETQATPDINQATQEYYKTVTTSPWTGLYAKLAAGGRATQISPITATEKRIDRFGSSATRSYGDRTVGLLGSLRETGSQ